METNSNLMGQAVELLPPEAVAQLLGVDPETLAVWRCTRRYPLAFVKVGRLVRYMRSDVEAFIQSRRVSA